MRSATVVLVVLVVGVVLGCGLGRGKAERSGGSDTSDPAETEAKTGWSGTPAETETETEAETERSGTPAVTEGEGRMTPWKVEYADGSANVFRFWQAGAEAPAQFEYAPVTPERSSSGTYSGGEARSGLVGAAAVEELWRRVEGLEAQTTIHTGGRSMGTGRFTLKTPGGERVFLIRKGAELEEFDEFLGSYRTAENTGRGVY